MTNGSEAQMLVSTGRWPAPTGRARLACLVGVAVVAALVIPAGTAGATTPATVSGVQAVAVAASSAPATVDVAGHGSTRARPRTATASCTFNGQTTIVPNVSPGSSIAIVCSGWSAGDTVYASVASPLFASSNSTNDIDPSVQTYSANGSGDLSGTFIVPNPFSAPDPAAVCPPTAAQVAQGYLRCFIAMGDAGGLTVFKPDDKAYTQVAEIKVPATSTYSYPIIDGNHIFIKDQYAASMFTLGQP